jgi:hypothetical protein
MKRSTCYISILCFMVVCSSCKKTQVVGPPPTLSKEFVFPHTVGTTWTYRYSSYSSAAPFELEETHAGIREWQVQSFVQLADSMFCDVRSFQQDTIRRTSLYSFPGYDTTFVIAKNNHFAITFSPDSIHADWTPTEVAAADSMQGWIPRFLPQGVNTIDVGIKHGPALYVNGIGLTSYLYDRSSHSIFREELSLVSFIPK